MKNQRIYDYCKFLETHKQVYCNDKNNIDFCQTLTSLYLECLTSTKKKNVNTK